VVGRSLEISSWERDLAEDTWSEVSLGTFGMAIVWIVENEQNISCLQQKGDKFQEGMMVVVIGLPWSNSSTQRLEGRRHPDNVYICQGIALQKVDTSQIRISQLAPSI